MAKRKTYTMTEKLFIWPGETANWHFLPITKAVGAKLKSDFGANSRGFGSLPVEVCVGETVWTTSIFPERTSGSYILPVKAKVRKSESLMAGEMVTFDIKILV